MTAPHIAEGRIVVTWCPEGVPLGCITGQLHATTPPGFEVDWIIRFPESLPGAGAEMCLALLPVLVERYQLRWVLVKIHDAYKPEWLTTMARRFGFVFQERQGPLALWRKDL